MSLLDSRPHFPLLSPSISREGKGREEAQSPIPNPQSRSSLREIMDAVMEPAPVMNSFPFMEQHHRGNADLNKKRKLLQYELGNSGLPWPKHKVRDRSKCSVQGSSILQIQEIERDYYPGELVESRINDGLEQHEESKNDSDRPIATYDNTKAVDVKGKRPEVSIKPLTQDQPSTSSSSPSSHNSRSSFYSLDGRSIKEVNSAVNDELMDTIQVEPECKDLDEKYPTSESDTDYIFPEFVKDGIEDGDAMADDLMLYSNDLPQGNFALSSERWSITQDARLGARKPTIDQEFEQYFSTLML